MTGELGGKIVAIVGSSGLLGKACCHKVIECGGTIIKLDIAVSREEESKDDKATFYNLDITNTNNIQAVLRLIYSRHHRLDAIINCAYPRSRNYGARLEDVTYDDFCKNLNLHLGGYFLLNQQSAILMAENGGGVIVNFASIYGVVPPKFQIYQGTNMTMPVEYAAIKSAIIHLTRYFAAYYASSKVRVNSISPGGIYNQQPPVFVKNYEEHVLLGNRMARPDDIMGALVFLISDGSSYVTGQNIIVDGGWSL